MASHFPAIDNAAWDSPWRHHRVGEKVALSGSLVLSALFSAPWPGCLLVAVLACAFMLGPARIRPRLLLFGVLAPMAFLVIGIVPVVLTWGGPGFAIGPLRITQTGVYQATGILVHALAGTLGILVLATTTPMVDLLTWLRRLRVPAPLLEIASLTYRLLFLLLSTAVVVRDAQHARLGDLASWRRKWHSVGNTTGTVVLRSWQRATKLSEGLEGRGYVDTLYALERKLPTSPTMIAATISSIAAVTLAQLVAQ